MHFGTSSIKPDLNVFYGCFTMLTVNVRGKKNAKQTGIICFTLFILSTLSSIRNSVLPENKIMHLPYRRNVLIWREKLFISSKVTFYFSLYWNISLVFLVLSCMRVRVKKVLPVYLHISFSCRNCKS